MLRPEHYCSQAHFQLELEKLFQPAWRFAKSKTLQVHNEDRGVYASQQNGLERSRHPGVIGAREERIYIFKKYILETLGVPLTIDPANATVALAKTEADSTIREAGR